MRAARALFAALCVASAAGAVESDPAVLIAHGHCKQARALLESRLAATPKDADALVQMARVKLAFGDAERAKSLLQEALALEPKNAKAHLYLADAYSRGVDDAGFLDKIRIAKRIRSETEEALADDPGNVDAMGGLVSFYLQAPGIVGGSLSKAKEMAESIMAVDRVRGNFAQAEIASHEKQLDKLEGFYSKAVEADPKSYDAWIALGSLYLGERNRSYAKAEDCARKALAIDPGRSGAYVLVVRAIVAGERWADLAELLDRSERSLPDNLVAHYMAGRQILLLDKQPTLAERAFRKYLTQSEPEAGTPPLAGAHWRLGLALEKQGKKQEAVQEIETALRMKPDLKDAEKDLKRLRG